MVGRIIEFNMIETIKALIPAGICSLSMLLTTIPVMIFFDPTGLPGLLFISLLGGLTFLFMLNIFDHGLVLQAVQYLKNKKILPGHRHESSSYY